MKQYLLDTNVLLRFLLNDNEAQATQAEAVFRQAQHAEVSISIPLLVIVETVFALTKLYRFSKSEVIAKLLPIVEHPFLDIEKRTILIHGFILYRDSSISLIDALLKSQADLEGKTLMTFDKKIKKKSRK